MMMEELLKRRKELHAEIQRLKEEKKDYIRYLRELALLNKRLRAIRCQQKCGGDVE